MRIAIITESFLPTVNGVSNSVARVTEQLQREGHDVLIVAPGRGPQRFGDSRVVRTAAVPLPGYHSIPVGMPTSATYAELEAFEPQIFHVSGPVVLGAWGLAVGRRLGIPSVALYQTDFPRFARHYKVAAAEGLAWRWLRRIHSLAELTLAPSRAAALDLRRNGIPRVAIWGRGVDTARFTPLRRDIDLRARLAPHGQVVVGYVGRLAPEKNVALLQAIADLPGTRLVVVGDGPDRSRLQRQIPGAVFTGYKGGVELARLFASLDVFVHTGAHETFCQTIQEALSSGVPAVAPAIGGPLDLITHGTNGLLYRPGDGAALRRAVQRLVDDASLRSAAAARARPAVVARTWQVMTRLLLDHYVGAIDLHRSRLAPALHTDGLLV
ncbi:MAG: glycosyltransferase family 4 protein [Euzebya sp.]